MEPFVEPGRWVESDGSIRYAWPPEGRFADLWQRINGAVSDDEKDDAVALLNLWRDDNSTLVAYTDDNGEWVDVEPDYAEVDRWLGQSGVPVVSPQVFAWLESDDYDEEGTEVSLLRAALVAITAVGSLDQARGLAHAALNREEYHGHEVPDV